VDDLDSFDDMRESGEFSVELKLIGNADEKLGTGAVWLVREQRCHHCSLIERDLAEFRLETHIESTGPVLLPSVGVLCLRIATLNHTVCDDTVKGRAAVKALPCQINKFAHMVRRFIGIELEDELTAGSIENRLKRCGIFLGKQQQQKSEQDVHG